MIEDWDLLRCPKCEEWLLPEKFSRVRHEGRTRTRQGWCQQCVDKGRKGKHLKPYVTPKVKAWDVLIGEPDSDV